MVLSIVPITAACDGCQDANLAMTVLQGSMVGGTTTFGAEAALDAGEIVLQVGDTLLVRGVETNFGPGTAGSHVMELSVAFQADGGTPVPVGEPFRRNIDLLTPHNRVEERARFVVNQPGTYLIRGVADVFNEVRECDYSNNELTGIATGTGGGFSSVIPAASLVRVRVLGDFDPSLRPHEYVRLLD